MPHSFLCLIRKPWASICSLFSISLQVRFGQWEAPLELPWHEEGKVPFLCCQLQMVTQILASWSLSEEHHCRQLGHIGRCNFLGDLCLPRHLKSNLLTLTYPAFLPVTWSSIPLPTLSNQNQIKASFCLLIKYWLIRRQEILSSWPSLLITQRERMC